MNELIRRECERPASENSKTKSTDLVVRGRSKHCRVCVRIDVCLSMYITISDHHIPRGPDDLGQNQNVIFYDRRFRSATNDSAAEMFF